jgi:YHS domain-containing protein
MKSIVLLAIALFTLIAVASGQSIKRQKEFNLSGKHLAIEGYDPVAYFTQGKAIKGKASFVVSHDGVIYNFSSAENKSAFLAQPSKYEPQYGGWCAYAMGATGEKVSIDPETFKIVNGKLFLFYNKFFTNTLKSWNKDERNLNTKADAAWAKLFSK